MIKDAPSEPENFYVAVGRYMMMWQHVESILCTFFVRIIRGDPTTIRRVFYSTNIWESKKRMLHAALASPTLKMDENSEKFLKGFAAKVGSYQSVRNSIAHDIVVEMPAGHAHAGDVVLVHGKFDRYIADKEELASTTTLREIQNAHVNASALMMVGLLFLNSKDADMYAYHRRLLHFLKEIPAEAKIGTVPKKIHNDLMELFDKKKPAITMD
ncbi:hypothetical protein D3C80_677660 [compost metagenome]